MTAARFTDPFRKELEALPDQFRWRPEPVGGPIAKGRILVAGMGGSALAGELALARLAGADAALLRDEILPEALPEDTAVLCVSCSGNTGETLAIWDAAERRGLARGAVASGGALLERARAAGRPHCPIPDGLSPRSSLGYLTRAASALLTGDPGDGEPVARHLTAAVDRWLAPAATDEPGPAVELAWMLHGQLPVLLAGDPLLATVARRWVADLAENAKVEAAAWEFPEAAHNRLMTLGFETRQTAERQFLTLGEPRDPVRRRRWDAVLELVAERGIPIRPVRESHPDPWIEAVGLAHLGDWVSVLLAEFEGVPAGNLYLMDALKRRLDGTEPSS